MAAKATGRLGGTATSALVNLVVVSNAVPVVSLNVNAASTVAPATVTLSATASDSDGSVAKVAFYNGAALLGEVAAAPYTFVCTNVSANSYSITAVATDDRGATATSPAQALTITSPGGPGTNNVYYVHADQINTAREITDAAGVKVWEAGADPFGALPPNEDPSARGRFAYNQRFPGQYFDAETGLHYNYFRDYDPQTGRYVQSDPIGLDGGVNSYAYVEGNPLSKTDKLGLVSSYGIPDVYNTNRYAPSSPDPCGCAAKAMGLETAAGVGLGVGGQPSIPKNFSPKGASAGTSPISKGLSKALPQKLPMAVPAPTTAKPFATSNVLGRVLGRWAPVIGWGIITDDVSQYAACIKECIKNENCTVK